MRNVILQIIALTFTCAQPAPADETPGSQAFITYGMEMVGTSVGWAAVEFALEETGEYRVDFGIKFEFLFWSGGAAGATTGNVEAGGLKPDVCDVTVIPHGSEPVGMWEIFDDNKVKHWSTPPQATEKYSNGSIPLTEADKQGALDPLSALFIPAKTASEACDRTLPIFVFGTRFDLTLTPGRYIERGIYSCGVSYQPISGHRETSESVGVLMRSSPKLTVFEAAPGLWAPYRAIIPTRLGSLVFTRHLQLQ